MDCIYISLDQSTKKTGYCVWKNGNYSHHGLIDKNKIKESDIRFDEMSKSIVELLKKEKPLVVTIEDTALQTNAKTLKDLSQLQGIIIGYCLSSNISFSIYTPSKWRSILGFKTGKGIKRKELKEQAIKYVKDTYNIITSEDEAEAISIGSAVLSQY